MGNTSAAEAKLDARIRPDITLLRSVTPYPQRHRPSLAVLEGGIETGQPGGAGASTSLGAARSPGVRAAASSQVRLTRRGKIVVGALLAIAVASLAALAWFAVAGRAQAAGQLGQGGSAGHAMQRVVVQPGQTLWAIAVRADPAADPRLVIQEIVDDNGLRGTGIQAGQVLWVPRS